MCLPRLSGTSRLKGEISISWSEQNFRWTRNWLWGKSEERQAIDGGQQKCGDSCLQEEETKPLLRAEMNRLVIPRTPRRRVKSRLFTAWAMRLSELGSRWDGSPGKIANCCHMGEQEDPWVERRKNRSWHKCQLVIRGALLWCPLEAVWAPPPYPFFLCPCLLCLWLQGVGHGFGDKQKQGCATWQFSAVVFVVSGNDNSPLGLFFSLYPEELYPKR